ncbi:MAG: DUF302 domain-containing protein [Rhodospirillales bacterium]|nr:DUF302 domain-containing protein [Rhodospirillales bacterium]
MSVLVVLLGVVGSSAAADLRYAYSGVEVLPTDKSFDGLWDALEQAVADSGLVVVTRASASRGAASRGVTIPGNVVIGVFRNDFAVRMLQASVAAGIEAPLRFYLVENTDGTATLVYQRPTAVFSPYGSDELDEMARELDVLFAQIAERATAGR